MAYSWMTVRDVYCKRENVKLTPANSGHRPIYCDSKQARTEVPTDDTGAYYKLSGGGLLRGSSGTDRADIHFNTASTVSNESDMTPKFCSRSDLTVDGGLKCTTDWKDAPSTSGTDHGLKMYQLGLH